MRTPAINEAIHALEKQSPERAEAARDEMTALVVEHRLAFAALRTIIADAASYHFTEGMPAKASRAALEQLASAARAALAKAEGR